MAYSLLFPIERLVRTSTLIASLLVSTPAGAGEAPGFKELRIGMSKRDAEAALRGMGLGADLSHGTPPPPYSGEIHAKGSFSCFEEAAPDPCLRVTLRFVRAHGGDVVAENYATVRHKRFFGTGEITSAASARYGEATGPRRVEYDSPNPRVTWLYTFRRGGTPSADVALDFPDRRGAHTPPRSINYYRVSVRSEELLQEAFRPSPPGPRPREPERLRF